MGCATLRRVKYLKGSELADYVKARQARQVRMLRQAHGIVPRLLIIHSINAGEVIQTYVRMKRLYGGDILVEVDVIACEQTEMPAVIERANADENIHGIILQLPLDDPSQTEALCSLIHPGKDVDGLGPRASFVSATAEAIDWLLAGHGVELPGKSIAIVGNGKLVGRPLSTMWRERGYEVQVCDKDTDDIDAVLLSSDVIVSATGVAKLLRDDNRPRRAVVVDAGTVSEDGRIVGDADPALQSRGDLTITPPKGGVGPLTIVLLFDHVIRACLNIANARKTEG